MNIYIFFVANSFSFWTWTIPFFMSRFPYKNSFKRQTLEKRGFHWKLGPPPPFKLQICVYPLVANVCQWNPKSKLDYTIYHLKIIIIFSGIFVYQTYVCFQIILNRQFWKKENYLLTFVKQDVWTRGLWDSIIILRCLLLGQKGGRSNK